jgi:hypothetical protein
MEASSTRSSLRSKRRYAEQVTCHCAAYPFPHRIGSGKCLAEEGEPLCAECLLPASAKTIDTGIGAYEYWGAKCVDSRLETLSKCCQAGFVANTAAHQEITVEADDGSDY